MNIAHACMCMYLCMYVCMYVDMFKNTVPNVSHPKNRLNKSEKWNKIISCSDFSMKSSALHNIMRINTKIA